MMRVKPPETVREICAVLERAGHEAWCVGGAVRDALLGIPTLDWDIATSAKPPAVQKLFKRTVPVGIKFGTVGVIDRDDVLHEVTTFRHDVETDGRHAVVKFGASLDEDLARRDFTVNAIAVHAERLELRDPFHGREDLDRRVIRAVGVPSERMREDRLRALRALRFAGRFGFTIEPATWAAIRESAPHLGRLSMERVKQELDKVMEQVAQPSATLERYRDAGIFAHLVPVLAAAPAGRFRAIDHLARPGLARRPDRGMLRFAAMFVEPGVAPPKGLEAALKALKCSTVETRATLALAEAAGKLPITAATIGALDDPAALRRLVASVGRMVVPGLTRLLWARAKAEGTVGVTGAAGVALYRRALQSAFRDPLTIADLAIDGEDLRRLGVPGGPQMGKMLQTLLDAVIANPASNTRDELTAIVKSRS
jgi:tRNA nucleotidyltransferase (CCA-adding enzyme)